MLRLRSGVTATVINVKPYWLIMSNGKILCDGDEGLPIVFDTNELALICVHDNDMDKKLIKRMELEELARMCRDRQVPFNKFILITRPEQLVWTKPASCVA